MLIDVITLTYNNYLELVKTLQSMSAAISHIGSIFIIYDGERPDVSMMNLSSEVFKKVQIIKGAGEGIYPAMNYALNFVQNNYIFINSGDQLVGNPFKEVSNLETPLSFSCVGLRNDGYTQFIKPNRMTFKFNHNSIIFPKKFKCKYKEKYSVAADFDIVIRLSRIHKYPKFVKTKGYLLYDLHGVSSIKKATRDFEYYKISNENKLYLHMIYYFVKYIFHKIRGFE